MIAPARVAAKNSLRRVIRHRPSTAIAAWRPRLHDDRDRALAADIATGVQRSRAALDHLIEAFSKRTVARLDAEIVEILRLSAYQLLHHTRVPAAAVVDDAVDLVRKAGKRSATGFVNAILRNISRKRSSLPLPVRPDAPDDPASRSAALDYLSITLSHPRWIATRWYDRLGFEAAEAWMRFNNAPSPLTCGPTRCMPRGELPWPPRCSRRHQHAGTFAPDAFLVDSGHPLAGPAWTRVVCGAGRSIPAGRSARGDRPGHGCSIPAHPRREDDRAGGD